MELIGNGFNRKWHTVPASTSIPIFVRLNEIKLRFDIGTQTIAEKCESFENCLQSMETALSDLTEVYVGCSVDQTNQSDFNDHSALFNYLGNRLLQICNTFQRYTFIIWIDSDENLIANSIASILELPQIIHCERVNIGLGAFLLDQPIQLPIESISSWLVGMGIPEEEIKIRKKGQKRFLKISSDRISNAQQICEHLKEVNFQFHSIQLFIILVIHRAHVGIISR